MLAILALSLLIVTQTTLASNSDDDGLDLRDQSHLLEAAKKTITNTPNFEQQCSPADIGLIIDSSRSISNDDFKKGKRFLIDLLENFDIGSKKNQDRVAAILFGEDVCKGFDFKANKNTKAAQNALRGMTHCHGVSTNTHHALLYMRDMQTEQMRSGTRQIQLVLTDGRSDLPEETARQAQLTKEANITVVAVGVGEKILLEELVAIAGGVKENAHTATSYTNLDMALIHRILLRLCKPCGEKFPADVNFVFSAATMGVTQTTKVTDFIRKAINHKKLKVGFQFGVVSGDCPDDAGFKLNQYNNVKDIKTHLKRYNLNRLPSIVQSATATGFNIANGARVNATKTAVIFLGKDKVNTKQLVNAIKKMLAIDVRVFVSAPPKKVPKDLLNVLPDEVTFMSGQMVRQVTHLVNGLCPNA